jgi:hypothetical protein
MVTPDGAMKTAATADASARERERNPFGDMMREFQWRPRRRESGARPLSYVEYSRPLAAAAKIMIHNLEPGQAAASPAVSVLRQA